MNADIHGLSGAYAVDALDDVERAEFESHLAQCPECRAEVESLRAAAVQLTRVTATTAPDSLRASVLDQIKTVRPLPPLTPPADTGDTTEGHRPVAGVVTLESRRWRSPVTWLVAAAAAAVLAIGGLVWSPWSSDQPQQPPTATEQVIRAKDAQRYEKVIDGARATIVRSPSLGKAVIIADNMPAAPDGKDFQVWFQNPDGEMVSAGLMPHEARPSVSMVLDGDASKYTGVGITLEPAGGSPAPTSEPIALFEFS
ncbi:MAG TPA: anti-sigma factor [Pedococcus sp.]|jgi:anti-sigma-K factor RskA|uniref:anti-sigma factor n=1 Tax=Pedococcus sp. TaxID=2860345 RepID=UPI002F953324